MLFYGWSQARSLREIGLLTNHLEFDPAVVEAFLEVIESGVE